MDHVAIVARALRRRLDGSFTVCAWPDHPHLMSGPNLLVGGQGKLTAIFLIGPSSNRNLLAARLALPMDCRCVAVADDAGCQRLGPLDQNFDEVFPRSSELAAYCATAVSRRIDLRELARSNSMYSTRQTTALLTCYMSREQFESGADPFEVINSLPPERGTEVASGLSTQTLTLRKSFCRTGPLYSESARLRSAGSAHTSSKFGSKYRPVRHWTAEFRIFQSRTSSIFCNLTSCRSIEPIPRSFSARSLRPVVGKRLNKAALA
jgi:hypothetical protein